MRHIVAWGVLLACTASTLAQVGSAPLVQDVTITNLGSGRIDFSFVELHTSVRTNAPLDRRQISRDVRALLDSGRFTTVTAFVEPLGENARVIYALKNKLRLVRMPVVEGNMHYRPSRMQKLLDLKVGSLVDDAALGDAARNVIEEYQEDRYPDAALTWSFEEIDR